MLEAILSILLLAGGVFFILHLYKKRKNERPDVIIQDKITMDKLLNEVKIDLAEAAKDENIAGRSDDEWEAAYMRKKRIRNAMRNCVYGIDADKIIVRDLIRDVVRKRLDTVDKIAELIDFNGEYLEPMVQWEVLMYFLKKRHGKNALPYLIDKYNWDRVRYDIENNDNAHHRITAEDLDYAYHQEIDRPLDYFEQLDIIAIILFSKYKGFGCIDTLREQNVDGINLGVSGSIMSNQLDVNSNLPEAPRSIWIYFRGKYIHMSFLTTYTEEEMRRIILLICMYNSPGPLTEKRGYMVNTMYDKSRVLAIRPSAAEYWACFIRKFNISKATLEGLYNSTEEAKARNSQLPVNLIKWLMKGRVTCAFTGRQGTGKTTAMIAALESVDARLTLRVLEMAPEMYLRERYPDRNILSVSETQYVSASELQDALKKSDAAISIVGEVATDAIAARMIQMGQVASLFTIFSHHANRTKDLVSAITNSIVATSAGGATPATIQPQVIDVIKIDVHLDFDVTGFRYFERITEIVPVDKEIPKYDPNNPTHSINSIMREFFDITAVGEAFETRDLIRYNKQTGKYEAVEWASPRLTEYMLKCIPTDEVPEFKKFVTENWRR